MPVAVAGVGGGNVADFIGSRSLNPNVPLTALAGCDAVVVVGVEVGPAGLSRWNLGKLVPALAGLVNTGVRALRKSV